MSFQARPHTILLLGLTSIFIGYLTVWLPGPAAGLSFIGVELGEWIKFLGVGRSRDLFYLPPITLGLLLALMTVSWDNHRWQTWVMRGLAVAASVLAFPAIEAIRFEPTSEWLPRLQLILLVVIVVLLSGLAASRRPLGANRITWLLMAVVGLVGLALPSWMYFVARPLVSQAVGLPIGVGLGVWLNGLGHLAVVVVSLHNFRQSRGRRPVR